MDPLEFCVPFQVGDKIFYSPSLALREKGIVDPGADLVEGKEAFRPAGEYPGDVEAEGGAEDAGRLPGLQGKNDGLKLRDHGTEGNPAEIAAVTFAVRNAIGKSGKIGSRRQFGFNGLNGQASRLLVSVLLDIFDDVARVHGSRLPELTYVLLIVLEYFRITWPVGRLHDPPNEGVDVPAAGSLGSVAQENALDHQFAGGVAQTDFARYRIGNVRGLKEFRADAAGFETNFGFVNDFSIDNQESPPRSNADRFQIARVLVA
jgi:hypothetical protein